MKTQNSLFTNFFLSGHSFERDEILLKFKYQVLNTVLLVMGMFTFIFATLSLLNINPLGTIQTIANYILVLASIILLYRLRCKKTRYYQTAYLMYVAAFFAFVSALMFVPHDEFRIIWFYLLAFAAYITGGIRAGNYVSIVSVVTILIINNYYDLKLSSTAIISSVLGLIIASLFFRAYTKKIVNLEKELIEQEDYLITQSRLAAMGEMMSMIAHQWRQPLSTTTMMITKKRVNSLVEGKEQNEYDKILDSISETMVYLSNTIDDFQTYFKPEKATQKIDLSTLIDRIKQFTDSRLKISRVELHVSDYIDEELNIYSNEVIQVVLNIINNAIDIIEEREVNQGKIWINFENDDNYLIVSIEDNAGGIKEDIIKKIFEPYFSSKSKNGTGLGLYMSKMIIEKHTSGTLSVQNTINGANFIIKIPKLAI